MAFSPSGRYGGALNFPMPSIPKYSPKREPIAHAKGRYDTRKSLKANLLAKSVMPALAQAL